MGKYRYFEWILINQVTCLSENIPQTLVNFVLILFVVFQKQKSSSTSWVQLSSCTHLDIVANKPSAFFLFFSLQIFQQAIILIYIWQDLWSKHKKREMNTFMLMRQKHKCSLMQMVMSQKRIQSNIDSQLPHWNLYWKKSIHNASNMPYTLYM